MKRQNDFCNFISLFIKFYNQAEENIYKKVKKKVSNAKF